MVKLRFLMNLLLILGTLMLFLLVFNILDGNEPKDSSKLIENFQNQRQNHDKEYNLWIIYTKVIKQSPLYFNFRRLLKNLLSLSSIPLVFHLIVDEDSKTLATIELNKLSDLSNFNSTKVHFYDVKVFSEGISDIVQSMRPFFSSEPGTYYSDALFYISLGLHRMAPNKQKLAVMIDCDVHFKKDSKLLFQQFDHFKGHLFALAPELSPVYKHVLHPYKLKHNTTFGEFLHTKPINLPTTASNLDLLHPYGYQGYNSGVVLFNLTALRLNEEYNGVIKDANVTKSWIEKYRFRGHLGDQDFYTLLGFEKPHLIYNLSCIYNRQLCTWWKDNGGYKSIFDNYFKCGNDDSDIVVMHGNCNSRIPD